MPTIQLAIVGTDAPISKDSDRAPTILEFRGAQLPQNLRIWIQHPNVDDDART